MSTEGSSFLIQSTCFLARELFLTYGVNALIVTLHIKIFIGCSMSFGDFSVFSHNYICLVIVKVNGVTAPGELYCHVIRLCVQHLPVFSVFLCASFPYWR